MYILWCLSGFERRFPPSLVSHNARIDPSLTCETAKRSLLKNNKRSKSPAQPRPRGYKFYETRSKI